MAQIKEITADNSICVSKNIINVIITTKVTYYKCKLISVTIIYVSLHSDGSHFSSQTWQFFVTVPIFCLLITHLISGLVLVRLCLIIRFFYHFEFAERPVSKYMLIELRRLLEWIYCERASQYDA